jgi:hypothetical protein
MIKKILLLATGFMAMYGAIAQYSTGDKTSAAEFEAILKAAERSTRDLTNLPPSFSMKKYAPPPQNQIPYSTCVAWSSAYAARTISYAIKRNMTQPDSIKKYAFSPGYLYYKVKDATDAECKEGASILKAMQVMTATGAILKKEGLVDCASVIPETTEQQKAPPYKIKDFLALNKTFDSISKNDILKIKKSLYEKKPVVISMKIYDSYERVPASGILTVGPDDMKIPASHAMCIIGYDDKVGGGSFEVMNSWGANWGNKGFFWLSYKQVMKDGVYAVELMDFEAGRTKLSGELEFIKLVNGSDIPLKVTRSSINSNNDPVQAKGRADYSLYKLTAALKSGDKFKIKFNTAAPCYIYIFGEDPRKKISLLFPVESYYSAAINSSNATYYLPSDSTHATLDKTVGKENFCILYSKSKIDFEDLMNYIKEKRISIAQGVKEKLGSRLIKKTEFRDDKISFQAPADDQSVLCFFVEMDHN